MKNITFIDLFAGMGGTRIGFEDAFKKNGFTTQCLLTSEIKPYAVKIYEQNFNDKNIVGDIQNIKENEIPDFDYLLAGFPCQPFSSAGKRQGFIDERGNLFFDIIRILKHKKPVGFLLENVDGLVNHDNGNTFSIIVNSLKELDYNVDWSVLNANNFGVPQNRKRVYIVGHLNKDIKIGNIFTLNKKYIKDILEYDIPPESNKFNDKLLSIYKLENIIGKSIKDKRGGDNNIHSWDIELKGAITNEQKELMNLLLKKRRMKKWAEIKNIIWMDGMPLTKKEIETFYPHKNLQMLLDDLTLKGYLKFEHPKDIVLQSGIQIRKIDETKEKGYNIVAGKLSFPVSKILDPNDIAPTIVATEASKLAVPIGDGIRKLTIREGLRLSGYPEWYKLDGITYDDCFDLIGNTVMPPVITEIINKIFL